MLELKSEKRIFGLDLMRAAAILMVLAGHCNWIFPGSGGVFTQLMALSGFLGVEVFFVLSGFLIGRIIYRQFTESRFNLPAVFYFLKRRWFRTLPNYFLILMVNILLASVYNVAIDDGLWRYFFFMQNFASPMLPFFTESWSLSVEEFAYIFLPFSLLLVFSFFRPSNKSRQFLIIILSLILVFIATKIFYDANTVNTNINEWNQAVKSVVVFRLDSIFIGVLAAWISINFHNMWQRTKYFWLLLGVAMMGFFAFGVGSLQLFIERHPFFWNVVYLPLCSVSVAFFLPVLSEWKSWKSPLARIIAFVSLISYSIYLLHYGVVLQTMKHVVDTETLSALSLTAFTFTYLSITVFLSWILYRFYEKPMMDLRDKR